ncbi:MAG: DUF2203 domain-containing protein [Anaerolineales bacterium]|nr:DUF2203 domain-containing protein [Anaerolineales bacterium]
MPTRYFTVEQANALLPTIRPLVAALLEARQRIVDAQPELWPMLEKAVGNGGSAKATAVLSDFEIVDHNVKAIMALGLELKDVNSGLVDFLAQRDGREVYLCWRYDEPTVAHWHDLEAGFAGRQPLE